MEATRQDTQQICMESCVGILYGIDIREPQLFCLRENSYGYTAI